MLKIWYVKHINDMVANHYGLSSWEVLVHQLVQTKEASLYPSWRVYVKYSLLHYWGIYRFKAILDSGSQAFQAQVAFIKKFLNYVISVSHLDRLSAFWISRNDDITKINISHLILNPNFIHTPFFPTTWVFVKLLNSVGQNS